MDISIEILSQIQRLISHKKWDLLQVNIQQTCLTGGYTTNPPSKSVYVEVVSRESGCIAFKTVTLNDLDVLTADIQNA